jgi:hypothetical protein
MFNPEYREPKQPEWRPVWKMKLFYEQKFKLQCFIYLKYRLNRPRRFIWKYLFLNSEAWYYKYNRLAKELMKEAYKTQQK